MALLVLGDADVRDERGARIVYELPAVILPTDAVQVSCGGGGVVVVTSKREVWALGRGVFGEFGAPSSRGELRRVAQHADGAFHAERWTLVRSANATFRAYGWNADGRCGTSFTTSGDDTVRALRNEPVALESRGGAPPIAGVALGPRTTFFATSTGRLLACGWSRYGQTGTGANRIERVPAAVPIPLRIQHIGCARHFVIAVAADGSLVTWGRTTHAPRTRRSRDAAVLATPHVVDVKGTAPFVRAVCGDHHALVLDDSGAVWSCGYNADGQLGRDTDEQPDRNLLPIEVKEEARDILCGKWTSGFVGATSRHLYAFGLGDRFCNGLGYSTNVPTVVFETPIQSASLGASCLAAIVAEDAAARYE